jgi:TolA-binding protein
MPIRLNLLAEAQAVEEQRRKDPVKRAIWVAVLLIALVCAWASSLQLKSMVSNNALSAIVADMNACTNEYKQVVELQKKTSDMTQKINALQNLSANRFLNGTLLNALQQTTVENVQFVHMRLNQTYQLAEETKPRTNGSNVIPGTPAKVTEKLVLTLDGADSSPNPGEQVAKMKDTISTASYFQENLDNTNPVLWKNSSSPQLSPETGKAIVTFTLECRYTEKTR